MRFRKLIGHQNGKLTKPSPTSTIAGADLKYPAERNGFSHIGSATLLKKKAKFAPRRSIRLKARRKSSVPSDAPLAMSADISPWSSAVIGATRSSSKSSAAIKQASNSRSSGGHR